MSPLFLHILFCFYFWFLQLLWVILLGWAQLYARLFLFLDVVFCSNNAYFDVVFFSFYRYCNIYFPFFDVSSFASLCWVFQCLYPPYMVWTLSFVFHCVVVCDRFCCSSLYFSQVFLRCCFYWGRNSFSPVPSFPREFLFSIHFFIVIIVCAGYGFPFFSNILLAMLLSFFLSCYVALSRLHYIFWGTPCTYSSQAINSSVRLWPFISVCGLSS